LSNFNACSIDDINYVKHGTCLNACNMRAVAAGLTNSDPFYLVYRQRYAEKVFNSRRTTRRSIASTDAATCVRRRRSLELFKTPGF